MNIHQWDPAAVRAIHLILAELRPGAAQGAVHKLYLAKTWPITAPPSASVQLPAAQSGQKELEVVASIPSFDEIGGKSCLASLAAEVGRTNI